ncbi:polymer-forming cytoskeletal protein [Rhodohalobacter sp. 614A]|uniref:polymer-forming cytoskeletal protein n=1 Tax=Rhodohalobacter sp. 614A TaxID=2908649 RepID=UPI001F300960|nr:polymer-forming cytoskeletal protein [Rhodohalobacter sp. 614A]
MGKYAIFIVSALIFSLLTYSSALRNALFMSNTRTVESHGTNQAYNIAQSAMMIAAKDLVTNGEGSSFYPPDSTYAYPSVNGFQNWGGMHGSYNIFTRNQGDTLFTIQSTGRFDGSTYIVSLGIIKTTTGGGGGFPWPAFDAAIYTEEDFDYKNGVITGDVYSGGKFSLLSNGTVKGDVFVPNSDISEAVYMNSGTIEGSLYTNNIHANAVEYDNWGATIIGDLMVGPGADPSEVAPPISQWHPGHVQGTQGALSEPIPEINMPQPEFPETPSTSLSLPPIYVSGNTNQTLDLTSGSASISSIDIHNDTNLTVYVGDQDRTLVVNDFNVTQGHLNVVSEGEGRLQLFIQDSFTLNSGSTMNHNLNPGGNQRDPLSLLISYAGSGGIEWSDNQRVNANLFIKEADFAIGGSTDMKGNIISTGEFLKFYGDSDNFSRLIYAPNAHIQMGRETWGGGSPTILGSIVAKTMNAPSNITVTYSTDFEDTLPDLPGSGGGGGAETTEFAITYWN